MGRYEIHVTIILAKINLVHNNILIIIKIGNYQADKTETPQDTNSVMLLALKPS